MTAEELRRLYETAASPEDVRRLLVARGRSKLGLLLSTYRGAGGNTDATARHFEELSRYIETAPRPSSAYFEAGEAVTVESRAKVSAALRWAAQAWRRWEGRVELPTVTHEVTDEARDVGPVDKGSIAGDKPWTMTSPKAKRRKAKPSERAFRGGKMGPLRR